MQARTPTEQTTANTATLADAQHAGRNVPRCVRGLLGVDSPIGQPIEGHRRAAGRDHAQHDAQQLCQRQATGGARADSPLHAITAANSANGSANSVWLKRIISRMADATEHGLSDSEAVESCIDSSCAADAVRAVADVSESASVHRRTHALLPQRRISDWSTPN